MSSNKQESTPSSPETHTGNDPTAVKQPTGLLIGLGLLFLALILFGALAK